MRRRGENDENIRTRPREKQAETVSAVQLADYENMHDGMEGGRKSMQPSWRGRQLLRNDHPPTLRSACRSHDTYGACVYRLISVGAQTSSCYQDDFLDLSTELVDFECPSS